MVPTVPAVDELVVQFWCDPEYGGDGQFHDAFSVAGWHDAVSFLGWESDYGRDVRIVRGGQVLADPSTVRSLSSFRLESEGFRPSYGVPAGGELLLKESERKARCLRAVCRICGQASLDYRGFYRPGRHRAFSVCPVCGDAVELV